MSIKNNKEELLNFLNIKDNFLSSNFKNNFRKIIKKRTGKKDRIINPPNENLKKIQKKVLEEILIKRKINNHSFGLSGNILKPIKKHQKNVSYYFLNLDIEDFFPSISYKMIKKVFLRMGFNNENSKILTILTSYDKFLPQGAPTSSYLSSLVLEDFDKKISKLCRETDIVFTRYIDDMTISGKSKQDILNIEKEIKEELKELNLHLNFKKRQFFNKDDEKEMHGILIKRNGFYTKEDYINKIELEIKLFKKNSKLNFRDSKKERQIKGMLNYCYGINKKQIRVKRAEFFNHCKQIKKKINKNILKKIINL